MGTEGGSVDVSGLRKTFDVFSPALIRSLTVHVKDFADFVHGWAITHYMTGGHPLNQRSGNLIRALNVEPVTVSDNEVSTSIGDNIAYAAPHELGGYWTIPPHTRHITQAFGRPITPKDIGVRAYNAYFPQRAFLAPSIDDNRARFEKEMNLAASEAAQEAVSGAT